MDDEIVSLKLSNKALIERVGILKRENEFLKEQMKNMEINNQAILQSIESLYNLSRRGVMKNNFPNGHFPIPVPQPPVNNAANDYYTHVMNDFEKDYNEIEKMQQRKRSRSPSLFPDRNPKRHMPSRKPNTFSYSDQPNSRNRYENKRYHSFDNTNKESYRKSNDRDFTPKTVYSERIQKVIQDKKIALKCDDKNKNSASKTLYSERTQKELHETNKPKNVESYEKFEGNETAFVNLYSERMKKIEERRKSDKELHQRSEKSDFIPKSKYESKKSPVHDDKHKELHNKNEDDKTSDSEKIKKSTFDNKNESCDKKTNCELTWKTIPENIHFYDNKNKESHDKCENNNPMPKIVHTEKIQKDLHENKMSPPSDDKESNKKTENINSVLKTKKEYKKSDNRELNQRNEDSDSASKTQKKLKYLNKYLDSDSESDELPQKTTDTTFKTLYSERMEKILERSKQPTVFAPNKPIESKHLLTQIKSKDLGNKPSESSAKVKINAITPKSESFISKNYLQMNNVVEKTKDIPNNSEDDKKIELKSVVNDAKNLENEVKKASDAEKPKMDIMKIEELKVDELKTIESEIMAELNLLEQNSETKDENKEKSQETPKTASIKDEEKKLVIKKSTSSSKKPKEKEKIKPVNEEKITVNETKTEDIPENIAKEKTIPSSEKVDENIKSSIKLKEPQTPTYKFTITRGRTIIRK